MQTHQTLAPALGVTPPPQDGYSYRFLSDVIMARGLVEPGAMKAALQASLSGRSLPEILIERGAIDELDLAHTVAEHHRLDHVDLDVFDVDHEAAALVEAATAGRVQAVPIAFLPDGGLVVAVADPNATPGLLEIGRLAGKAVQPAVASRSQIAALIESLEPFAPAPPIPAPPTPAPPTPAPPLPAPSFPAATIASTPAPAPAPAPPAPPPAPHAAAPAPAPAPAPEKHLRAVPAVDALTPTSTHPADVLRPTAPPPALPPMQTRNENEERALAAEELARIADGRARAAEERAAKAERMITAANSRAEGLMAAATAANEALARLVGNCEVLERDAKMREGEMLALRSELDSERSERVRLESELRQPQASEEMLALHVRIAELERELTEARAPVAQSAPPPVVAYVAPPPVVVEQPRVQQPDVAAAPPVAEPEVQVAAPPPTAVTIDILGEPGVPYVSALAPMPPVAVPVKPKNPKADAKARGLRRLIGALKRG